MPLNREQKLKIEELLAKKVDDKLSKYARETSSMPFLDLLMPSESFVASYSFVHSIATSLGTFYQDLSRICASSRAKVEKKIDIGGTLNDEQKKVIEHIVNDLIIGKRKPNRKAELEEILKISPENGTKWKHSSQVDFYMKKGTKEYFIEIKSPKPNITEFRDAKLKLLQWICRKQNHIYPILALPYNPYGESIYDRKFTFNNLFDQDNDIKIGKGYWDFLGGSNTYEDILKVFEKVGKDRQSKIKNKIDEIAKTKKDKIKRIL